MNRRNWFKSLLGPLGLLALPKPQFYQSETWDGMAWKEGGHMFYSWPPPTTHIGKTLIIKRPQRFIVNG